MAIVLSIPHAPTLMPQPWWYQAVQMHRTHSTFNKRPASWQSTTNNQLHTGKNVVLPYTASVLQLCE